MATVCSICSIFLAMISTLSLISLKLLTLMFGLKSAPFGLLLVLFNFLLYISEDLDLLI